MGGAEVVSPPTRRRQCWAAAIDQAVALCKLTHLLLARSRRAPEKAHEETAQHPGACATQECVNVLAWQKFAAKQNKTKQNKKKGFKKQGIAQRGDTHQTAMDAVSGKKRKRESEGGGGGADAEAEAAALPALGPACPLAAADVSAPRGGKLQRRLFRAVARAAAARGLRRGVKEVVKALRKGARGCVMVARSRRALRNRAWPSEHALSAIGRRPPSLPSLTQPLRARRRRLAGGRARASSRAL